MAELLKRCERWEWYFANDSPSIEDERLFRSLNMANAAAMLPAGADAKLYDIVRSVALWASAFETLYPAKKDAYKGVYAAPNSIFWNNSVCSTKRYGAYADKSGALYSEALSAAGNCIRCPPRLISSGEKAERNVLVYAERKNMEPQLDLISTEHDLLKSA